MSDLSLTIKLRDNLSRIVEKHKPKVMVIGVGDIKQNIEYLSKFSQNYEIIAISKPLVFGLSQMTSLDYSEQLKQSGIKTPPIGSIISFNDTYPIEPEYTSPKSFGMKKMGINQNRNFKNRKR